MSKILILSGIFVAYIVFVIVFVIGYNKKKKKAYEQSILKISDAEIFKLMTKFNHFITVEQLAATTILTLKEAKERLSMYTMHHVVRCFQSSTGQVLYQLKEEVPLTESLPACLGNLNAKQIVEILLLHVDNYQVTVAELVVIFGIDIYTAKKLIKRLKRKGLIVVLRKGLEYIYAIKTPLGLEQPKLRKSIKENYKLAIPEQKRIAIPDADIIDVAIKNGGKLSSTLLCLKMKIPIDEAKIRLEELYEEGVFLIEVDEKNLILEYHLRNKKLLLENNN